MKLTVKNLKGDPFDVIVEPSDTVKQVKDKIEEEQKIPVDAQKLVAIGKVMADDKTIDEYKLKEGDFIVIMVSKPKVKKEKKPEPIPTPQPQPIISSGDGSSSHVPVPIMSPPSPVTSNVQPSTSTNPPISSGEDSSSGLLRGEQLENTLKDMQDMGFGREEWMRALRAAYYNPERAIDYLLNGIPEDIETEQTHARPQPTSSGHSHGGHSSGSEEGSGRNPLEFLRNNPMFDTLRQRLISEPQFFQTFMNQLAQTQPQLHQAISSNPQAFLQLLLGGDMGGDEETENDPPGTIRVTQEEKDAIDRLSSLGFPKHRVIEAYFAWDKNEEWAANYLFENNNADDNYEDQLAKDESNIEQQIDPEGDMYGEYGDDVEQDADMPSDQPSPGDNNQNQSDSNQNNQNNNQNNQNNNQNNQNNNQSNNPDSKNNEDNDEEGSSL